MEHPKERSFFQIAVVMVLIFQAIALAGVIACLAADRTARPAGTVLEYQAAENGQYVLYIGLNDKDTYTQIIPTEEAKGIVNKICTKYVEGYTVSEASGGWMDETGTLTEEMSLVYILNDAEEEDVVAIMDEALSALHQNSILVERREYSYSFYSGK